MMVLGCKFRAQPYEMAGAIKKLVLEESGLRVEVKPPFIDSLGGSSILVKFDEGVLELAGRISSLREALQELFNGSAVELVV
ncbi:hypothetical protein BGP81_08245 [Pseudomonas putida]|nr:hypothetical protein BGP81_08245 [Pseudomonas putida]